MASSWADGYLYSPGQQVGVACIATAGLISITSVLYCLFIAKPRKAQYQNTHVVSYYASLLVANTIQASGTVMNLRWVMRGGVEAGGFCSAQGGIKQAGNVATALWSFMISLHLFNLLFLRRPSTRAGLIVTLTAGWALVGFIIIIGPTAIQTPASGPYFSVAGYWCWISKRYWGAQTFLEYFLEFTSAGLGLILYTFILLRVRGNLMMADGKWKLRHVPQSQSWQLSIGRDLIDTAMIRVARSMVWYPVAYTFLLFPIAICRLMQSTGHHVPFWLVATSGIIFNLTGFVNVMLLLTTRRLFPDAASLPVFTTPRQQLDLNSAAANGITPFVLSNDTTPLPPPRRPTVIRRLSSASSDIHSVSEIMRLPPLTHS